MRSGRYQDAGEVVRDALRTFERGDNCGEDPALEELIQEGLDSGPAEPLTRPAWHKIWQESDRLAHRLRTRHKRTA